MKARRRKSIYDSVFAGDYFEGVLVLEKLHFPKIGQYGAIFKCHCGLTFERIFGNVKRGQKVCKSCESNKRGKSKHVIKDRRLYSIWKSMNRRCHNIGDDNYFHYGEKGITVCDSWRDTSDEGFTNFYLDMGMYPTTQHSVDRVNVNKGYSKGNCRWASVKVQANNKSDNHYLEWKDRTYTLQELGEELGIKPNTLLYRIRRGWSLEEAIEGKRVKQWKRPLTKLTDEQFEELLISYFKGGLKCYPLSKKYEVDCGNLSRILKRQDIMNYYEENLIERV